MCRVVSCCRLTIIINKINVNSKQFQANHVGWTDKIYWIKISIKKWDNFLPSICRNSQAKSHFTGMLFFSLALSLLYSFFFVSEISWNTIYILRKNWLQLNHQQFDIPTADVSQLLCDLISFAYVFQFSTFVNYLQINTLIRDVFCLFFYYHQILQILTTF